MPSNCPLRPNQETSCGERVNRKVDYGSLDYRQIPCHHAISALQSCLSHHVDHLVDKVEEIDMKDLRKQYENYDPRINRIVDMIPEAQSCPLFITGPLKSWSSPRKSVVLMGDNAHSMVNNMAQGAATLMEDSAFLGRCIGQVVQNRLSLQLAITIYERRRMPNAHFKQQVSFLSGAIWHLPDEPAQEARDEVMRLELEGKPFIQSPNLYGDCQWTISSLLEKRRSRLRRHDP